jgi:hypothetical protein
MERNCFGHCAMNIRNWASVLVGFCGWMATGYVNGDPVAAPPVDPSAEAAYQLEAGYVAADWRFDPTIFTDISPVSVPEVAIKLPEDQRDDG